MTAEPDLGLADAPIARVAEFIEARTWRRKYRCFERGPVALDHPVASLLATSRAGSGEPLQAAILESYARLLRRCADLGPETALAETAFRVSALRDPGLDALASGAHDRWTAYVRMGDVAALDSLIADYSELAAHRVVRGAHPAFRLAVAAMLGQACLGRFLLRRTPGDLERALELLRACTAARPPRPWFVPPPYHAALARALDARYAASRSLADLEAAQRWLRDSTNADKRAFLAAAAGIDGLGEAVAPLAAALADPDVDPDAREDQELRAWAGFTYVGCRLG
jgi:hypothetical protein